MQGGIKRLLFHEEVEVRKGVLEASDGVTANQEFAAEDQPRKISRISKPFNAMITAAVNHASVLLRKSNSIPLFSV